MRAPRPANHEHVGLAIARLLLHAELDAMRQERTEPARLLKPVTPAPEKKPG